MLQLRTAVMNGANLLLRTTSGMTVLHLAVISGHANIVAYVLQHGRLLFHHFLATNVVDI